MASITIRNLDAHTKARLRVRAALEENDTAPRDLGAAIGARFRPLGGVDLALPAPETTREPPRVGRLAARPRASDRSRYQRRFGTDEVRTAVATRNVGDYDDCGIKVMNPWDD